MERKIIYDSEILNDCDDVLRFFTLDQSPFLFYDIKRTPKPPPGDPTPYPVRAWFKPATASGDTAVQGEAGT